jgi:hypothetical protein
MSKLRFDDTIKNMSIRATDGDIGKCVDLLFDERFWTARYLVVETGGWLSGKKVLIPIVSVDRIDLTRDRVELCSTMKQIEDAPGIDTDAPVSRRHEISILDYYAYSNYWALSGVWGGAADPMLLRNPLDSPEVTIPPETEGDPYLRSVEEIIGYQINTVDDDIGTIKECYVCPRNWFIKYIEVETGSWFSKQRVLLKSEVVSDVSWTDRTISGTLSRQDVENAPAFTPPLTEALQADIDEYYAGLGEKHQANA